MEQLVQKHIRYFYLTLIGGIMMQLLSTIRAVLFKAVGWEEFVLMFVSLANLILLFNNLRHNYKQQFTECKISSKILRFTMGLLLALQAMICYTATGSIVMLLNHAMMVGVVEIVFTYRIKTIEYLEDLASKYKVTISQKGDAESARS